MNNLVIGGLVYNEANKFLQQWLEKCKLLTNKIVIIDDGSTDNSVEICSKYTSNISITNRLMTTDENKLRTILWNNCVKLCKNGDYILIIDNDELLTENSIKYFEEALYTCDKFDGDAIAHIKYDMWNQTQYRDDKNWFAHKHWWVWTIKYNSTINYIRDGRKFHSGVLPINAYYCALPTKLQVQHMAYSTLKLRQEKAKFYNTLDPDGKWAGNTEQYISILDENPNLVDFKDNFEDT